MDYLTIANKFIYKERIILSFQLFWRIIFLSMIADRFTPLYILSGLPEKALIFFFLTKLICIFLSILWLIKTKTLISTRFYPNIQSTGIIFSHLNFQDYCKILSISLLISCLDFFIFFLLSHFMMSRYVSHLDDEHMRHAMFLIKVSKNIILYFCTFLLFSIISFFRNILLINNNGSDTLERALKANKKCVPILKSVKLMKTAFVTAYALIWRMMLISMIGNEISSVLSLFIHGESFPNLMHELGRFNGIEIIQYILSGVLYAMAFFTFYLLYFSIYVRIFISLEDLPFQKFKLILDSSIKGKIVIGICFFLLALIISMSIIFGIFPTLPPDLNLPPDLELLLASNIQTFGCVVNLFVYTAVFYLFAKLEWIKFEEVKINPIT